MSKINSPLEIEFPSVQLVDRSAAWEKEWNCNLIPQPSAAQLNEISQNFSHMDAYLPKRIFSGQLWLKNLPSDYSEETSFKKPWCEKQFTFAETFATLAGAVAAAVCSLPFSTVLVQEERTMTENLENTGSLLCVRPRNRSPEFSHVRTAKRKLEDLIADYAKVEHRYALHTEIKSSSAGPPSKHQLRSKTPKECNQQEERIRQDREERRNKLDERRQKMWEISKQHLEAKKNF